ncbi:G-type lectin S-receptor-like serine/threonine-protein kinase RKS1 [Dichanthelium oligosanthes]|uniref:non-specific serine/threonine protein kinase n=1 Tax=Dichanthelium oligosanthes TaxID=888268 RepID=A0A1E5WH15_9POAL|nr:G-type lectin S-receptor-like serine/threonine-protein kinase RKS1 [Dichanthelium oligosanthes]
MEDLGGYMAGPPDRLLRQRRLMDIAPASPSDSSGHSGSHGMTIMVSILVVVIVCTLFYCVYCWRWRKRNAVRRAQIESLRPLSNSDLPLMDLTSIYEATNSFSKENKLGEGGFGPVYRGVLGGGAEIAVKRLSARSRQGAAEFRNEVELIAKLQHRNLVRLLGCCVERDEKMLIYEYLPNRSLDAFLFGQSRPPFHQFFREFLASDHASGDTNAWRLWNEDRAADFMDASLAGSYSRDEACRCFHVGLLCVQENPELRPTMSNVVLMLISDQMQMPAPAQPPLFARYKKVSVSEFSLAMKTETTKTQSVNEVSITMIEPR